MSFDDEHKEEEVAFNPDAIVDAIESDEAIDDEDVDGEMAGTGDAFGDDGDELA